MSPHEDIASRLDDLQLRYEIAAESAPTDVKLLQGIERCVELRMKLYGLDGKTPPTTTANPDPIITIDLAKLSTQTLKEIINLGT